MFLKSITTILFLYSFIVFPHSVFSASGDTVEKQFFPSIGLETRSNLVDQSDIDGEMDNLPDENKTNPIDLNIKEESSIRGEGGASQVKKEAQTLKEMQEEKVDLEKEKERLEFRWNTFRIGSETLGNLIRPDISVSERETLETLLINYTTLQGKLEEDIQNAVERSQDTASLQKELLQIKADFYKGLTVYIETSKIELYKQYIESDITYNEKSKQVATEIEEKETEIDNREEYLQEKIEDNAAEVFEQIRIKMTQKLERRIDVFISQEKFQALRDDSKVILFERLIEKLQEKKRILEETENPTSLVEERIFLYEVAQEVLESYLSNWRE